MLAGGVAFVALRKHTLYAAQVPTRMQSPAHALSADRMLVRDVLAKDRAWVTLRSASSMADALRTAAPADGQIVIPVLDGEQRVCGVMPLDTLRRIAIEKRSASESVADVALPPVSVFVDATLRSAAETLRAHRMHQVPVIDASGRYAGMLDAGQLLGVVIEAESAAAS
jgi:CIC family chloride channel protein